MSYNLDEAANPVREFTLPVQGCTGHVKQLLTKDRREFLDLFARFLAPLALLQEEGKTTLGEQDVEEQMGQMLLDALAAGEEEAAVVRQFFALFSDLAPGMEWPVEDVEALWREVYRRNRIPFGFERHKQAALIKALLGSTLEERGALVAEMAAMVASAASSGSSPQTESTPSESGTSPGRSRSPSPRSSRGGRSGKRTSEPSSTPTP